MNANRSALSTRVLRAVTWSLALGALSLAGAAWVFEHGYLRFNSPDRDEFPVWGIDVSHHQHAIDWGAVAATKEIEFAFIKATEGGDWIDPRFAENWRGARAAGIAAAAYHFFTLCRPGADQAENFIRTVPRGEGSLPHVADLELGGNCKKLPPRAEVEREIKAWSTRIRDHYGREPIFYVTYEFYDLYVRDTGLTNELWIRDVFRRPRLPDSRRWLFWQFANRGRVKGIAVPVDLDAFCCDRRAWRELAREAPAPRSEDATSDR